MYTNSLKNNFINKVSLIITDLKVIEIFCEIDNFMIDYDAAIENAGIKSDRKVKLRKRKFRMFDNEIMTIMVPFHLKSYRNLKEFYSTYVCKHMQDNFPETVSYNRFVELQKRVIQPLAVYLKLRGLGKCTGISYIDSTPLKVSHIKREKQHRVFKGIAEKSFHDKVFGKIYGDKG